ncbi:amino acid adenylation domain-containing protein, partial [Tahibacter caeni]|uniref:amino acid adenylation domain-containing protein n=1 Tax=Tahibacter caeni TaxID=1453545 RepID=UPI0021489F19
RADARCRSRIDEAVCAPADEDALRTFLRREAGRPFDLQRGPLARIALFAQDAARSVLLITVHHLIFDGGSGVLLLKTLLATYRGLLQGREPAPAAPPTGNADFVAAEAALLASPEGALQAAYWQRRLDGIPEAFELVPQLPQPADAQAGAALTETLAPELAAWLRRTARDHAVTPSAVLLAAYAALLHRYSGADDIVVGMPVSPRSRQRYAEDIGYFVNMVPLRLRCEADQRFTELLQQTQTVLLEGLYHSAYPFALMRERGRGRAAGENPVYQVSFALQDFLHPAEFARAPGEPGPETEYLGDVVQQGDAELALDVFDAGDTLVLQLKYAPRRYTRDVAARLLAHYVRLLEAIRAAPDGGIGSFPILSEGEEHRLLQEFNDTHASYPKQACIHDLFVAQAQAQPARTALVHDGAAMTYAELERASRDLAVWLQANGVRGGCRVGLCMDRSAPLLIGLLGILRAGAAVVSLDPDYPPERLAHLLQDCGATLLLTRQAWAQRLHAVLPPALPVVCWDDPASTRDAETAALRAAGVALQAGAGPGDPAYLIYTSGSTGQPKGVLVEHRSLVNENAFTRAEFAASADDATILFSSASFDVFMDEVFRTLNSGGRLVLAPKETLLALPQLQALIAAQRVNVLFLPTAFFHELAGAAVDLAGVRRLIVAGEKLDYARARAFVERHPGIVLHNAYGPTETTVFSSTTEVTPALLQGRDFVPIGRPIANTQIYVLDRYGNPQPPGVAGELCIGGDGVARGYWGKPELTRERFVANPFVRGTRLYRTGDLARWLEDGSLQYLGRRDAQVKIRGYRIEPGEIEACLHAHPAVDRAVVVARGDVANRQLVAYYRRRDGATATAETLRTHLQQTLPAYMIPQAFVALAAIPLTPAGKIDRRALERLDVNLESARPPVAARTPAERELVAIWAEVLRLDPASIGVHDSFFELGGHSLLAMQLLARIRDRFGVELPLKALFDGADIAGIAAGLDTASPQPVPRGTPVDRGAWPRLPLSHAQERLWFLQQLDPANAAYNVPGAVRIAGALDAQQLEQAFAIVTGRHEILRTVFEAEHGRPAQRIRETIAVPLARSDLSELPPSEREARARALCAADAAIPFDLAAGPLLRGRLLRLAGDDHVLMLNLHHIVCDGWSLGLLVRELGETLDALRQDREPRLAPLAIQYADYAIRERERLDDAALRQRLERWGERLAGLPERLALATDHPRPARQSAAGATVRFAFDAELTAALRQLAAAQQCTLFMVLLAAVKTLLYRYTGQEDLCIGSPVANRSEADTGGLVGMFVNTLALRTTVRGDAAFADVLAAVRDTCLAAFALQDTPFEKVVEHLRPPRDPAITPLFQVMVALQNADGPLPSARLAPFALDGSVSKFDLDIEFRETAAGIDTAVQYCTALFRPERIARLAGHLRALCRAAAAAPQTPVAD